MHLCNKTRDSWMPSDSRMESSGLKVQGACWPVSSHMKPHSLDIQLGSCRPDQQRNLGSPIFL